MYDIPLTVSVPHDNTVNNLPPFLKVVLQSRLSGVITEATYEELAELLRFCLLL